jgi:hypothetical protein
VYFVSDRIWLDKLEFREDRFVREEILNITNGDYFNNYLTKKIGGLAIPFREVIMDGEVVDIVYSDEFVKLRVKALNVSENEYRSKMNVCEILSKNNYSTICLWFGKDTFCQMNLLALLVYLEQIEYQGKLILNYIDDETFEQIESNIDVKLGIYEKIYRDILISKYKPKELGVLHARAVDLYFDYHSNNGMLATLIKNNADKSKSELLCLLLEESKDYGLSDLQAERLINIYLSGKN